MMKNQNKYAIVSKSVNEELLRKAEHRLVKLRDAQSKIGTKDFGLCKKCQKPIPLLRIMLIPESPYCVNCSN